VKTCELRITDDMTSFIHCPYLSRETLNKKIELKFQRVLASNSNTNTNTTLQISHLITHITSPFTITDHQMNFFSCLLAINPTKSNPREHQKAKANRQEGRRSEINNLKHSAVTIRQMDKSSIMSKHPQKFKGPKCIGLGL
jgi:hypothetical protein